MIEKTLTQLQDKLAKKTIKLEKLQRPIEEQSAKEMGLTLVESFYDEANTKPKIRGYVNGDGDKTGEWTRWHENGNIDRKGSYTAGYRTGEWTYWYANGNLESTGIVDNGKRTGEWKVWLDNGTLHKVSQWHNGNEMEVKK
jgi:antitoxin component YwqK of YwqJK toxin-antitoxin module